ncbi:ParA family protein [Homoserinibacter sp. YIM 151385]|uniref:ParA family protein n=1 Tax=Homoserinibacter sp. YIM 151385 TaxID=2985506 RepID=UPI0022F0B31F|nr:AAA family ATPase [Homoserinibacter sp. YIM 151385]WBU38447.1 AAA family ATPase [Homoserinibacter sp. YIM 151385]
MSFKIISVFNHKGGVSKTTTTFNLAWMLARQGKRVVMVDADPQCNLTGVVLGLNPEWPEDDLALDLPDDEESSEFAATQDRAANFWEENFERTLFGALKPAFDSEPRLLEAVDCVEVEGRPGLYLLPGHLRLGEYEVSLGIAQELAGSISSLRNLPGAVHYLLTQTAEELQADYVIIDMSPSLGALNQNLVSISDLLIVPTSPDFFSIMALQSLSQVLPRWARWAAAASENEILRDASYPFPPLRLKLGGIVIQRYRLYRSATDDNPYGTPTSPFRAWIDRVRDAAHTQFIPALRDAGLTLAPETYGEAGMDEGLVLAQVQEFNSLLPKSQDHHVPVFELTAEQLDQVGVVLEGSQAQIESLDRIFDSMATRVTSLLD